MKNKNVHGIKRPVWLGGMAVAILSGLFVSCVQDDNDIVRLSEAGSLQLTGMYAEEAGNPVTRAGVVSDYPTDRSVGFFVKPDVTKGYAACYNREGRYNAARSLWLPVDSIWLNNNTADLGVYAPYDNTQSTASGTLQMKAGLRPADGSKDIWYKHFTANNKSLDLAPVLEHIYTRLTLTVSLDKDYKGDAYIGTLSLAGGDCFDAATFHPFDAATPYVYSGAPLKVTYTTPLKLSSSDKTRQIDLLVIPRASLAGNVQLVIEGSQSGVTNKFTVTIDKAKFGNALLAGKQYQVNVTLKPTELEVTSVTLADWADETIAGDKEPSYVGGIQVAEADINLGSGCTAKDKTDLAKLRWADGNLKSTGSSDYVWTTSTDYGYYYPWLSTYEYDGYTGTNNIDPCSRLNAAKYGTGWRTPSRNEFEKLSRCTDKAVATYNGVKGMWFMNKTKGLFLPFAGFRSRTGSGTTDVAFPGTYGDYWTSDALNDTNGYRLDIGTGNASVTGNGKTAGFTIRCVQGDKQ